jgi:predicted branched-subunit amino acid permease
VTEVVLLVRATHASARRHDAAVLSPETRAEVRAGFRAVAPMLVGVIPFGLVAGATPATTGLGGGTSIGLSTLVFAGASQLAAADALADRSTAIVAIIAACTINLRLLLYSASLAPYVSKARLRTRLLMAYVLTDQAYAVSILRWNDEEAIGQPSGLDRKLPYYFGAAFTLWVNWQICTIIGVLIGSAVPKSLPLEFAVPLVFLVLLVPAITSKAAVVAATVGGVAALLADELGAAHTGVLVGAVAGIAAGAYAELLIERRAARR